MIIDQKELRSVLGTFVTGVTVITTQGPDGLSYGVTANSFSSVSLDPPLVLWSQSKTSKSFEAFQQGSHFAVNVLAEDQVALSNHFAKSQEDKFRSVTHRIGAGGAPVLDGAAAWFECRKVAEYPGGDHVVYLGQVEHFGRSGRKPLAFGHGKYLSAYAHELGLTSLQLPPPVHGQTAAARRAIAAMPSLAAELGEHSLCLSVWANHGPVTIYWEPSAQPVSDRLYCGLVMSVTQSATGCAFAAFMPATATRAFIEEDFRTFHDPACDMAQQHLHFDQALELARQRGIAMAPQRRTSPVHGIDVTAFSVPIYNEKGEVAMALTLVTPASRLAGDPAGPVAMALKAAADRLSQPITQPVSAA